MFLKASSRGLHILADSNSLFTNPILIEQLNAFSVFHGFSSPVWLSAQLASSRALTPRFLSSPLSLWLPPCGEQFFPISDESASVGAFPLNREQRSGVGASIVLLSVTGNELHSPTWMACPNEYKKDFNPSVSNFWVSSLLKEHYPSTATCNGDVVVIPFFSFLLFNTDQLMETKCLNGIRADAYGAICKLDSLLPRSERTD